VRGAPSRAPGPGNRARRDGTAASGDADDSEAAPRRARRTASGHASSENAIPGERTEIALTTSRVGRCASLAVIQTWVVYRINRHELEFYLIYHGRVASRKIIDRDVELEV
jgi:hypothetical protein